MPEIRKDYITNNWVVIAKERSKRPSDFKRKDEKKALPERVDTCPFCPGNEQNTPPEILAYRSVGTKPNTVGWWIRAIPNKFPALRIEGDVNPRVGHLTSIMNGVGAHEVLVETPYHNGVMAVLPEKQIEEVLQAYKDRYNDLTRDMRFKYILIFKNYGSDAGASLEHPHSQIIALPMIPRRLSDELNGARDYHYLYGGACIYDDLLRNELSQQERIVEDTSCFVAIAPYASRFPFETWIIPKRHNPYFEKMTDEERTDLAKVLKRTLEKMSDILSDPPYNYVIHTAPCDGNDYRFFHWHIEITPRLTKVAGFEWGTGLYINPTGPEEAASFLKEIKKE